MEKAIQRFLDALQQDRGFAGNSIAAYKNDLDQFRHFVTDPTAYIESGAVHDWEAIDVRYLNQFVSFLKDREYANSSIARKSAAVKSFCHFLTAEGILPSDPASEMVAPKAGRYSPRAISPDQVEQLLSQPGRDEPVNLPVALRDSAMLQALYATGMRVSELVSLNTGDVDPERRGVRCAGKSGKTRDLPLHNAWDSLNSYLDAGRPSLALDSEIALFVNHRGGRLTRQGFWLILKTYADRAGVSDVTPHTLRHSFACNALQAGAGVREVQQLLGHVSISTTQVYRRMGLANEVAPVGVSGSDVAAS